MLIFASLNLTRVLLMFKTLLAYFLINLRLLRDTQFIDKFDSLTLR